MALEKAIETKYDLRNKKHKSGTIASKKHIGDRLVCVNCGKAVEINRPLTETDQGEVEKVSGFHLQSYRIVLYGYCQDCNCKLN